MGGRTSLQSNASAIPFPIDVKSLGGNLLIHEAFNYDVVLHYTRQHAFSKYSIIKLQHVTGRTSETHTKLSHFPNLQSCLHKHFQLDDLLMNASLPTKYRHPSILCVKWAYPDPLNDCLLLVTDPCLPLIVVFQSLGEYDLLLGIRSVLMALDFIHDKLSLSHNNIHLSSIFVNNHSIWKLGGFEYTISANQMSEVVTELLERLRFPGDQVNATAFGYHKTVAHCYDMYCYSRLVSQLVSDFTDTSSSISDFMQVLRVSCMHAQPRLRLPPKQLLAHRIFSHPMLYAMDFLTNYVAHTDAEKFNFFRTFNEKIASGLSAAVVCGRLLPKVFDSTIFIDPPSRSLIEQFLHPQRDPIKKTKQESAFDTTAKDLSQTSNFVITPDLFKIHLLPLVKSKFRVHERSTRLILLDNLDGYIHLIPPADFHDLILPEICLSVFDLYEPLSTLSLRALGQCATVLSSTTTLNTLRQVEMRLVRERRVSTVSTTSKTTSGTKSSPTWPRAYLFVETAPKIDRQSRELPANELHNAQRPSMTLAQHAALSPNYDPGTSALLQQIEVEELNAGIQPTSLIGNAVKLSTLSLEHNVYEAMDPQESVLTNGVCSPTGAPDPLDPDDHPKKLIILNSTLRSSPVPDGQITPSRLTMAESSSNPDESSTGGWDDAWDFDP